jgi:single-strand DNA-binding protein
MNPKMTIVGRLGKDPEAIGTAGARLSVVSHDRVKNQNGEWEDRDTTWHTVKAWKTLGQQAIATLKKGQEVIIYGTFCADEWIDKEGQKRVTNEVHAESIAVTVHSLSKMMPTTPVNDPWAKETVKA